MDLAATVPKLVASHPAVERVEFVGSRARGTATSLSDWDFAVHTEAFARVAASLPELVAPLEPLAQQWDPLSTGDRCYLVLLRGPHKVDLIFGLAHVPEPPWTVTRETLARIDHHFWDWILWIAGKDAAGKDDVVRAELEKMSRHLLAPLGAGDVPANVPAAVRAYTAALADAEREHGVAVRREAASEVTRALRDAGFALDRR